MRGFLHEGDFCMRGFFGFLPEGGFCQKGVFCQRRFFARGEFCPVPLAIYVYTHDTYLHI